MPKQVPSWKKEIVRIGTLKQPKIIDTADGQRITIEEGTRIIELLGGKFFFIKNGHFYLLKQSKSY